MSRPSYSVSVFYERNIFSHYLTPLPHLDMVSHPANICVSERPSVLCREYKYIDLGPGSVSQELSVLSHVARYYQFKNGSKSKARRLALPYLS
jgi:hypothetical protein